MPAPGLFERIRQVTGVGVEELAGGGADGELPLTDSVVNRLIARRLAGGQARITGVRVETLEGNRFDVHVSTRGPLPSVRVAVTIDRQPELPHSPILGMRWAVPGLGPLAMLAGPALAFFKTLPSGISVDGDRIAVDIGLILRSRGLEELLPLLTRLRLTTRPGAFLVGFSVRI